jgi:formylglycine-generating enzyme required for sulfatase activity
VTDEDPQFTYAVNAMVAQNTVKHWCVPGEERIENGITFVRICPGTFTMGSAGNDLLTNGNERPVHQVTLSEFWIGKTEITNNQYRRFKPLHRGDDDLPATNVSWAVAKAACEHFGGRLPTEAEWEYAARAGSRTAWSFGDDEKRLGEYAWFDESQNGAPHPVGTKKPNAWGLHDMHGNVWEWVADWYSPYEKGPQTDPAGPKTGQYRVLRGGSFVYWVWFLRSANRVWDRPENRLTAIGFRCVRAPRRQP